LDFIKVVLQAIEQL